MATSCERLLKSRSVDDVWFNNQFGEENTMKKLTTTLLAGIVSSFFRRRIPSSKCSTGPQRRGKEKSRAKGN